MKVTLAAVLAVVAALLPYISAVNTSADTVDADAIATSTPPSASTEFSSSIPVSNDDNTDDRDIASTLTEDKPSETSDTDTETPAPTSASSRRFSCLYEDGASDLYAETIGMKRTIFKCLMGTKCYQRANKYTEIQCIYPESQSLVSTASRDAAVFASGNYAHTKFTASPTSSEPRVLSVNIVLPTIAIHITDDQSALDAATVVSIEAATSTSTQLKEVPIFREPEDTSMGDTNSILSIDSHPVSSAVRLPGNSATSPHVIWSDEFPSVAAQERHKVTIDDGDIFSVLYMSNIRSQNAEPTLISTPPSVPQALAALVSPSSTAPVFTGSQPPAALFPLPSATAKMAHIPILDSLSLVVSEQLVQDNVLDPIYPQYTPIIPFITNGMRQPTPTQDDPEETKKGMVNADGIASVLQDVFHVPADKIMIDGKPVAANDLNKLGSGGSISVMVMDPAETNKSKNKAPKDDDDDDLLDDIDDDSDSETITHSLNVDRFKHRKRPIVHAHAHARLETARFQNDSGLDNESYYSGDSDDSDDSDSDIETDDDKSATEQPLLVTEEIDARATQVLATDAQAMQAAAQVPTVMLAQAPSAQQAAVPQGPAGVQRIADTTQIFLQAQPTPAAVLNNAVQTVAAQATPAAAAAPVASVAAPQVIGAAQAAAPVAAAGTAVAGTAAGVTAPAAVAAAAQAAPLAALNYSEAGYIQPAALADPATVGVYAQQQYYPALAAGQPIVQQVLSPAVQRDAVAMQGGLYANNAAVPSAYMINNQLIPQAIIPLDASLTELLARATASAATSASTSAEATTPVDDNGEEPASGTAADADDAGPSPSPRRRKAKSRKSHKSVEINDDTDTESAADAESANEAADEDATDSADIAAEPTHKSRSSGKSKFSKSKKSKAKDTAAAQDDLDDQVDSVNNDSADNADSARLETQSGYKRIGSTRQRGSRNDLRDEAYEARAEASAEARAAILSEIRAEASAEAAMQASAELHLEDRSTVRDEEASASRMKDAYETVHDYSRDASEGNYSYEYTHPRAVDDEGANSSTVERYASPEYENTSTWDVGHAAAWGSAHSNEDAHPYHSYDNEDAYHGASYGNGYGDYKVHYTDATPTVEPASEGSSSYGDNSSYSDNSYSPYERQYDESQSRPLNFVNAHADSAFARDAASAATPPSNGPHAVNELDPLSYATQGCSIRSKLPLSVGAESSSQGSIMVIGIPEGSPQATSVAPAASTVMVTKVITPAVEVVYASNSN
ncbi:hypothetical protein IWW42_000125 [Coemansia sp. RSA 1085]|nr:hypothetical protein IWW42_000125 [Coemansia sp. RSA 1085]